MVKDYQGISPKIDSTVFIAESADIVGKVTIEKNANIWYNVVIRADEQDIIIGENTNIQDGSVVHVGNESTTVIGKNVTVGHKALIHGCKIGKKIPSGVLAMGSPAKVIRELSNEEKENLIKSALKYIETANNHK